MTWTDLGSDDVWAKPAINHVAGTYDWMRDFAPDQDGNWSFKPDRFETRKRWARAIVLAFDPDAEPDPAVTFTDLDPADPFHRWAAIAVRRGWMTRRAGRRVRAEQGRDRSRSASRARPGARDGLDRSRARSARHDRRLRVRHTPGLRRQPPRDAAGTPLQQQGRRVTRRDSELEAHGASKPRGPCTARRRSRSGSFPPSRTSTRGWPCPRWARARHSIVNWGVRYVGYPYIWAGEWGFTSPSPAAFGSQPGPGFDCSGLSWWALRADDGVYWEISPPRPHEGWPLPQRSSAEMSRLTKNRLRYAELLPGDLMFYDGDGDGTVDHVDVYVGNGWSLDSSSSVGGVTLMWVETGWYRQHFVHGRRILPRPLADPSAGVDRSLQDRLLLFGQRAASTGLRIPRHDDGLGFRRQPPVAPRAPARRCERSRCRTP